jgi:acetyl-CoA decarbonylase/synthase complex subunit epsilon
MIGKTTPYQPTAGSNLNHAEIVSTKIAVSMIRRSKNPVIILGSKEGCNEYLMNLNIKKICTPRDMNLLSAIKKVIDDGHDLVIFSDITYYYLAQAITHLKHFSKCTTLTLDRYYHPNAHYSFPNMEKNEHIEALKRLVMLVNTP